MEGESLITGHVQRCIFLKRHRSTYTFHQYVHWFISTSLIESSFNVTVIHNLYNLKTSSEYFGKAGRYLLLKNRLHFAFTSSFTFRCVQWIKNLTCTKSWCFTCVPCYVQVLLISWLIKQYFKFQHLLSYSIGYVQVLLLVFFNYVQVVLVQD